MISKIIYLRRDSLLNQTNGYELFSIYNKKKTNQTAKQIVYIPESLNRSHTFWPFFDATESRIYLTN